MVACDRIIYTSTVTDKIRGYQIVAHSEGVKETELKEVEKHSLPSKTIPTDYKFSSAIRLYRFSSGRIGISKLINTGIDEFGRPNRIYTYTLVMDENTFPKIGYNPFVVDEFSPKENLHGIIPPIEISGKPLEVEKVDVSTINYLQKILENLMDKKKIIIVTDSLDYNKKIMRDILSLLPPSIRANCSFSTFSMLLEEPYRVLFIPYALFNFYSLPEDLGLVDLVKHRFTPTKDKKYPIYVTSKLRNKDIDAIKTFTKFLQDKHLTIENLDLWYQYWINTKNLPNLKEVKKGKILIRMAKIAERIDTSLAIHDYKRAIDFLRIHDSKTLEDILEELIRKKFAEDIFVSAVQKMDKYRYTIAKYYEKFVDSLPLTEKKTRHYKILEEVYKKDRQHYYNIKWKRAMALIELGEYNNSFKILVHLLLNNPAYIGRLKPYLKKLEEENQYAIIRKLLVNISKNIYRHSPNIKELDELYKYLVKLVSKSKKMVTTSPKEAIENFLTMLEIIPYYRRVVSEDRLTEEIFTPCVFSLPYAILHYAKKEADIDTANRDYISFLDILFRLTTKPPEKVIKPTINYIKHLKKTKKDYLIKELLETIKYRNKKFYKEIKKYI